MSRKWNVTLWSVQVLLALLYLFAGGSKLLLPVAELTKQIVLPGAFLRFLGASEVLAAAGLILPGLLRIRRELTPLAAVGLLPIMAGATILTYTHLGAGPALMPLVVGLLDVFVAWERRGALKQSGGEQCLSLS